MFSQDTSGHTTVPQKFSLRESLHSERHMMEKVDVPVVTVSSTFLDAYPEAEVRHHTQEIVYSRAHYSQALACLIAAARLNQSSWLVDPTNYVSAADWWKVLMTEKVAETLVRHQLLMKVRKLIEDRARDKLPIHSAIKEPLLYVTTRVKRPILSLHYETANILIERDQTVLSVVTDPYVRDQYLIHCQNPRLYFAVFDEPTRQELLAKAKCVCKHSKAQEQLPCPECSPTGEDIAKRVFVTGPPVDPRIVDTRKKRDPKDLDSRPLRLAITTGGTGTNKPEIEKLLNSLAPRLRGKVTTLQVIAYAGTHPDFRKMFEDFARRNKVEVGKPSDSQAEFRILHGKHLMEANELLTDYMFPWADLIITKPSGDMAYDAAAAGCALIFLNPLGPWEEAIQKRFEKLGIGLDLKQPEKFAEFLVKLEQKDQELSWIQIAQSEALKLPKLYLQGAKNIVQALLKIPF